MMHVPVHPSHTRSAPSAAAPSTRADATRTATSGARWPRSCWASFPLLTIDTATSASAPPLTSQLPPRSAVAADAECARTRSTHAARRAAPAPAAAASAASARAAMLAGETAAAAGTPEVAGGAGTGGATGGGAAAASMACSAADPSSEVERRRLPCQLSDVIVAPSPWMPSGGVAGAPLSACHNWTALAPRRAVATSAPPTAIALSAPPTRTDRRLRPLSVTLRTFAVRSPRASARRGARTTEPCRRESTRCRLSPTSPHAACAHAAASRIVSSSAVAVPPLLAARTSVRSASPHG